jgi:hypothetical protein
MFSLPQAQVVVIGYPYRVGLGVLLAAGACERHETHARDSASSPSITVPSASAAPSSSPSIPGASARPTSNAELVEAQLNAVCDRARGMLVLFNPQVETLDDALPRSNRGSRPGVSVIGPVHSPFDCALEGDHSVRVKIGDLPPMPYGFCGGDPPLFASIWVDRAKVISARDYSGRCLQQESPLAHVRVTPNRVTWCTAVAEQGELRRDKGLHCVDTRIPGHAKPVDGVEFPSPGSRVGRPGTILVDYATNSDLCEAMTHRTSRNDTYLPTPLEFPPGSDVGLLKPDESADEDGCLIFRGRFDFDNDSAADDVLLRRCMSNAFDGDEYFVAADHGLPQGHPVDEKQLRRLRRKSRIVIPLAWANGSAPFLGRLYKIRHLHADQVRPPNARASSASARHTVLRLDYLHLEPFRYGGVTYLLSAPPDWAAFTEDTFVLFRAAPKAATEEVCVFHQVQENY